MRRTRRAWWLAALAALACGTAGASDIADSAEAAVPLEVGATAPTVTLRDVDGEPAPLDAVIGAGPVALVFYRGGW